MKVLILSAKSDVDDRVRGLNMGANDYMVKPFEFIELEARIRCLLRMKYVLEDSVLVVGGLKVDTQQKQVYMDDEVVKLRSKEYLILEYLMINRGKVISSEELIEHVWDSEADLFSTSLKFHIYELRKKLSYFWGSIEVIKNIRGQGYIIYEEI